MKNEKLKKELSIVNCQLMSSLLYKLHYCAIIRMEPGYGLFLPEPGHLPFRIPAGMSLYIFNSRFQ
jgi:hypothetical protein